jgi:hypothetical protein
MNPDTIKKLIEVVATSESVFQALSDEKELQKC